MRADLAVPAAFMTNPKEPYLFSHDDVWERCLDWHEALFASAGITRTINRRWDLGIMLRSPSSTDRILGRRLRFVNSALLSCRAP